MNKGDEKMKRSGLSIDRAAFILLRVKRVFKKKKQQLHEKNMNGEIKNLPKAKPPLMRSRTLPSIVVPGLNILQAQIDFKYKTGDQTFGDRNCFADVNPSNFVETSPQGRRNLAYHRLSSPDSGSHVGEGLKNFSSSHFLGSGKPYRILSNSSLSSTALHRLAKLLNQKPNANLEAEEAPSVRRLSWEKKERSSSLFQRSSSIDSIIDPVWQSNDSNVQFKRLYSPLICRTEKLGSMVSPSLARKQQKGSKLVEKSPIRDSIRDVEKIEEYRKRLVDVGDKEDKGMDFLVDGFKISNKKKVDKINKINIHLRALFAAVESGHVEKARTILESTDVDVNSVNGDGFTPLEVAILTNRGSLAKMLLAFGAREGNQFRCPEKLENHLKSLSVEADKRFEEFNGGSVSFQHGGILSNLNNNRASFSSVGLHPSSSSVSCQGTGSGAGDSEKELLMLERRSKGIRKMISGFDQTRPPDPPFSVTVDVTGTHSVAVRYQGPELRDSFICTKYKVQWSESENFDSISGEKEIMDVNCMECSIDGLDKGKRYWFRTACGNLKGYGNFKCSTPASVVPSSWRDVQGREPRFSGRLCQLEKLFGEIRSVRPETASEIKDFSDQEKQGETVGAARRNQKKKTIKQLFTVAGKFQKHLKRGVYLVCLFYHEDKILVTNEDFLPAIEVDETYPSSINNDLHWLMKVACTWSDVKSLKQDMEKNLTSTTSHFRIKLLQAAQQMQSSLSTQDLGRLYYKPIRDAQGTLAFCCVNSFANLKSISVLNLRWTPIGKIQKKMVASEESNVGELLMASIQSQIAYHRVTNLKLSRGLYLGYLKMKSSVDLIQIIVPNKTPNVLPHCKVRSNPHVSSDEWEWLRRINSRHKSTENLHSKDVREVDLAKGTEQQQMFVEQVASTARKLFSYLDVSFDDAMLHRLYDVEVVDLNSDVSFLIIVPPAETSCSVPGQRDILLDRGDLMSISLQVFEMVHFGTYQPEVISRYSRLSCILELDLILAQHSHREAFSSSEVQTAKDRLSRLQQLQIELNGVWKSVRWIMDLITFARDRNACSVTTLPVNPKSAGSDVGDGKKSSGAQGNGFPTGVYNSGTQIAAGVPMKNLLALTKKKEANGKSSSRMPGAKSKCLKENHHHVAKCEKRTLLRVPDSPKDPKISKSNVSRGSWPGPGADNPGSVLDSSFSKSEQHLNVLGGELVDGCSRGKFGDCVPYSAIREIDNRSPIESFDRRHSEREAVGGIGNRMLISRSEDHLFLSRGPDSSKQSCDVKTNRTRLNANATTSVSATNSPLLPQRNFYDFDRIDGGIRLSVANADGCGSMQSVSSDESTAAVVSLPVTTPFRTGFASGSVPVGSVDRSASLMSLAKPVIPSKATRSKVPVTVSLNSLMEIAKRSAASSAGSTATGSILSGNVIPVDISQRPSKSATMLNPRSPSSLDTCLSAHHCKGSTFARLPGTVGSASGSVTVKPCESPIKAVSPIDAVLSEIKVSPTMPSGPSASSDPDLRQRPEIPGNFGRRMASFAVGDSDSVVPSGFPPLGTSATHDAEKEDDSEELENGVKVPTLSSGVLQVYAAYETGLAAGTSLKLHVTPRTSAREVVDIVVKQLNMAVLLKGKEGPIYQAEKLKNFCLVAVIGARERCLRDDFKPLQLQNPWKKGRLYVRQKQDVLAALEQSSRRSALL